MSKAKDIVIYREGEEVIQKIHPNRRNFKKKDLNKVRHSFEKYFANTELESEGMAHHKRMRFLLLKRKRNRLTKNAKAPKPQGIQDGNVKYRYGRTLVDNNNNNIHYGNVWNKKKLNFKAGEGYSDIKLKLKGDDDYPNEELELDPESENMQPYSTNPTNVPDLDELWSDEETGINDQQSKINRLQQIEIDEILSTQSKKYQKVEQQHEVGEQGEIKDEEMVKQEISEFQNSPSILDQSDALQQIKKTAKSGKFVKQEIKSKQLSPIFSNIDDLPTGSIFAPNWAKIGNPMPVEQSSFIDLNPNDIKNHNIENPEQEINRILQKPSIKIQN